MQINHTFGSLYSGYCAHDKEISYLGMGYYDNQSQWCGHLIEFDTNKLEVKRNLATKSAVNQIQKVNRETILLGEREILELVNIDEMKSLHYLNIVNRINQI